MNLQNIKIGIIGLGYVGFPLAALMSKQFKCIGFDISSERVDELNSGFDRTEELSKLEMQDLNNLSFTLNIQELKKCNFFIVTVPTPIDASMMPDFSPLESASSMLGSILKKDDIVVYESTVYPGATEEKCIPILEKASQLNAFDDFLYGYSPERINPGDKTNRVENIVKVTSGCNEKAAALIDDVYSSVITAGTFKAASVRVAEAAKVIENAQRDVNIAFMNQISLIFSKLDINTSDVLDAAATKWNFLKFSPGLVGGHCIGVDPYYLISKSQEVGCDPVLLKVARDINEGMVTNIVNRVEFSSTIKNIDSSVLILGATFKEDCPDLRNSKVANLYNLLVEREFDVSIIDPVADANEMLNIYGDSYGDNKEMYDIVILAVPHVNFFKNNHMIYESRLNDKGIIFDVKSKLDTVDKNLNILRL
jgi:UDP-N-acetyl-D-glucosamine/UDP-N-acetyl-D-galactosamine dehydrogenase